VLLLLMVHCERVAAAVVRLVKEAKMMFHFE
jgi:hypothetical protein